MPGSLPTYCTSCPRSARNPKELQDEQNKALGQRLPVLQALQLFSEGTLAMFPHRETNKFLASGICLESAQSLQSAREQCSR